MDTEEEDILAIYKNLIKMIDVFTNPQIDFIFSIRNYCKKKRYTKYLLLQTNDKYKVVKKNWLLANALLVYSFKFTLTFVLIN